MKINWRLVFIILFGVLYIWMFTAIVGGAVWIISSIVKFDCLTELIKIMTYDVENGGMREAGLKQLEYIRQEYSKLERENCGLNQTVFNLRKRVESKYSSGTQWTRCSGIEKVSHD